MENQSSQIVEALKLSVLIPQHYTIFATFLQGKNGFGGNFAEMFTDKENCLLNKEEAALCNRGAEARKDPPPWP